MTLLRALAMPFQFTSLLLVALLAVTATLVMSVVDIIGVLAILPLVFLLSWLNKYACALLDHAANGVREAPVASAEMLGPFGGARPLVHVVLGVAVYALAIASGGRWSPWIAGVALLLFPVSVGALAMHERLLDAISPVALWRTLRGFAHYYLLLLAALAASVTGVYLIAGSALWRPIGFMVMALLWLCLYALIGGVLYTRRIALGFEPRVSPEWIADRDALEHERRRQRIIDDVYGAIRVRDPTRASATLRAWLRATDGAHLAADAQAMVAQATQWPQQRGLQTVARTAIEQLLRSQQPSVALAIATTTLVHAADFALDLESDTVTLSRYALLCARRPAARALLDNFVRSTPERKLGEDGASLRRELDNE